MAIEAYESESGRVWLLSGDSSSYALTLTPEGDLVHLHWGPRVALADAVELAAEPMPDQHPCEGRLDGFEEYPLEGGLRFARPALMTRAAVADSVVRGNELTYSDSEISAAGVLSLSFADRLLGLIVVLHYRMRPEADVIERWVTLTALPAYQDRFDITLLRADPAAWSLPLRDTWRLSHLHGRFVAESQLARNALTPGEHVLGSRHGHTSHNHLPWFALDDGSATEEHGEVWSGALAWSGNWRIAVQQLPSGRVQVVGGAGGDDAGLFRLLPGGTYTSPVFAALYTDGGFGAASRAWHRYQLGHVIPRDESPQAVEDRQARSPEQPQPQPKPRSVLYNSWEATVFDISESSQMALADKAAGLGVELFVVDDGWFGRRRSDRAGLGDWTPAPELFPNGLGPLAEHVRGLGMQFGIWVEPEMVNPDSDLYRAHPDWVQHEPMRRRTEWRNQLVLNLGREDVRAYLWQQMDTLLRSASIDYLKWDFNRSVSEPGWPGDAYPERLGVEQVYGFYELVDRLRAAHPGVAIESCAGGGGRIDLGVLSRTDQVWVSDNTDPLDRLHIQHGLSQLHPARVAVAWVTDSPNLTSGRVSPLRFRFVSAMAGVLGVGGNLVHWSEQELEQACEWIARYKRVRPVIQFGELYRLRAPQEGPGLSAVQYIRDDETVVLAWLGGTRYGAAPGPLRLRALDPAARYLDTETGIEYSGALLLGRGLTTGLGRGGESGRSADQPSDLDAGVFHLRRIRRT
jgi:alpha-galactosidase